MTDRQRWTVLLGPALVLAAIVLPMAVAWDDLPDSMATHWDLGGTPNGHMPPTALLLVLGGIFVAMWLGVWYSARRMPFEARSFISGLLAVGGLLAAVQWFAVDANRGAADWTEAGDFTGLHLIVGLGAALILGLAGWFLAGRSQGSRSAVATTGPMLDLDPGTTPVWSSRGRGNVLVVTGIVLLGVAVVMWSVVSLILILIALLVLVFSEVRATASSRGVVVSLGWLGIPSWVVPLSTITGADVEEVSPMAYGGWGYRVRPGARAVVVRGGSSLRLHRADRPDLVLTVDDPEMGAGLVNALVTRLSNQP